MCSLRIRCVGKTRCVAAQAPFMWTWVLNSADLRLLDWSEPHRLDHHLGREVESGKTPSCRLVRAAWRDISAGVMSRKPCPLAYLSTGQRLRFLRLLACILEGAALGLPIATWVLRHEYRVAQVHSRELPGRYAVSVKRR